VIVDSTRRGKKFPDALYATVPIWAAVINLVIFPHLTAEKAFFSPPWMPETIRDQILKTIPKLLENLPLGMREIMTAALGERLSTPMVPLWALPGEDGMLEWFGEGAEEFLDDYLGGVCRTNECIGFI